MTRAIVYVDGFNLYYGALRDTPHKWLDLEKYFRRLRNDDELKRIHYFTARVDGPASVRQALYLRAIATLPLVHVVLGKFKLKRIRCQVQDCTYRGLREFDKPEEKRTDVNIALQLLDDALNDRAERLVVVSGDSDLVPALKMVKEQRPQKQLIVYVPTRDRSRGAAVELRSAADKNRDLPRELLPISQFPNPVLDGHGGHIDKPIGW